MAPPDWIKIERTTAKENEDELRDLFWRLDAREVTSIYGTQDGPVIVQAVIRNDGRFKP